jgi:riboflavin biosynthesis pyrimidine reductase
MEHHATLPPLPQSPAELDQFYGDPPVGVRANMVQSVDGAGAFNGRTLSITDPSDQHLLKYLRGHADVILVGSATVQAENYGPVKLSEDAQEQRRSRGYAALPPLALVTASGLVSPDLRCFDPAGPRTLIVTGPTGAATAEPLRDVADIVTVGAELDPTEIIQVLRDRGLARVLCEGGPFLLSRLIEQDLVDDMCLTVSPYLAGTQPTTPQPASARDVPTRLRLRHVLSHDDMLYLRYSRP